MHKQTHGVPTSMGHISCYGTSITGFSYGQQPCWKMQTADRHSRCKAN